MFDDSHVSNSWEIILRHSFNKYLLNNYYKQDAVLGEYDRDKRGKVSALTEQTVWRGENQ